jgi:hypothetical protein
MVVQESPASRAWASRGLRALNGEPGNRKRHRVSYPAALGPVNAALGSSSGP